MDLLGFSNQKNLLQILMDQTISLVSLLLFLSLSSGQTPDTITNLFRKVWFVNGKRMKGIYEWIENQIK